MTQALSKPEMRQETWSLCEYISNKLSRHLITLRLRPTLILLKLASFRWQMVIREQKGYMLPGLKPQYTGAIDVRLLEMESFGEYLKQTVGMLNMNMQTFQTLKDKSSSFQKNPDGLLIDYEFLLEKARTQIEQNTASIPVITAMIAVEESRKAIQQANDVKCVHPHHVKPY